MPEVYAFTVKGNHESLTGNPVPYVRTTQRGKWVNAQFRRYQHYRNHIIAAFLAAYPHQEFIRSTARTGKPIEPPVRIKVYCHIRIWFASHAHCDSDNLMKAFLDSLFSQDKWVAGSFDYSYDADHPRVEVSIGGSPFFGGTQTVIKAPYKRPRGRPPKTS